jgi:hypothetical protein
MAQSIPSSYKCVEAIDLHLEIRQRFMLSHNLPPAEALAPLSLVQ